MGGNAKRKAAGGFAGRPPLLDANQRAKLIDLHSRGEHSIAELAKRFNLSEPGVYKYVAREKRLRSEPGSSSTT
jgi:transposase